MKQYDHNEIEPKWQREWAKAGIYKTPEDSAKPKCYVLDMFPYPSGEGLHVGHPKGYIGTDVYARYKKMNGFSVLHPMGWDAFGLPAENYALKHKIHPRVAVEKNIARFKDQLEKIGFTYDWSREINTSDPSYYKWTQWIFLQLFKKGLAYESYEPINWCPSCKTGLANEDLEGGKCERCGSDVLQKPLRQWVLKIREYADRLLADVDTLNWPESVKEAQRNWIGRSDGAEIKFPIARKYKFVLLHGFTGTPDECFIPWLKSELEQRGHEVVAPALPNTNEPTEAEWIQTALSATTYDENTILCGHSLGAVTALKVAEKLNKKIASLVLVGGFVDPKFKDHARNFEKKFDWKFDNKKIHENVGHVTILHDRNDEAISLQQAERLGETLGLPINIVEAQDSHFCGVREPEILKVILPSIKIFTTRPDTLFGATYLVLAPEHPIMKNLKFGILNLEEIKNYQEKANKKTDLERTAHEKEKTGVELKGIKAVNPATKEEIPIWIADYVLAHYGTGAIMAVPAHDERDFQFAQKFNLPIKRVISHIVIQFNAPPHHGHYPSPSGESDRNVYSGLGELVNSGEFDGMDSEEAKWKIADKFGERRVDYKLRDWVFSRQRYWGEPIPLVFCEHCAERIKNNESGIKEEFSEGELLNPGWIAVPDEALPVKLPEVKSYEPSGTGESPLANLKEWVETTCPKCGGAGKRETNTMPQWAGSSWYYLRYIDPRNATVFVDKEKEKHWSPVDLYVGGADHATRHLIYARFWHKVLFDLGFVAHAEPFMRLKNQGNIQGEDGRKMSKRWGNVVNPDDIVERFGADTLRVYEMFMGPFEEAIAWNTDAIAGSRRFLERVWRLQGKATRDKEQETSKKIERLLHKTIKKVSDDIEHFKFNTAISALMIFANELEKEDTFPLSTFHFLLLLLSPLAPHIAEELWRETKGEGFISEVAWPRYESDKMEDEEMTIVVQVDGRVRGSFIATAGTSEEEIKRQAQELPAVLKWVGGVALPKIIYVPGRLVNIVTKHES